MDILVFAQCSFQPCVPVLKSSIAGGPSCRKRNQRVYLSPQISQVCLLAETKLGDNSLALELLAVPRLLSACDCRGPEVSWPSCSHCAGVDRAVEHRVE